jgi:hypothetical protein
MIKEPWARTGSMRYVEGSHRRRGLLGGLRPKPPLHVLLITCSQRTVSAGTSTGTSPALIQRLAAAYQGTVTVTGRTVDEIAGYFTGLQLVPPGLTDVQAWRPGTQPGWPPPRSARILGAVGHKPATPDAATSRQPGTAVTI